MGTSSEFDPEKCDLSVAYREVFNHAGELVAVDSKDIEYFYDEKSQSIRIRYIPDNVWFDAPVLSFHVQKALASSHFFPLTRQLSTIRKIIQPQLLAMKLKRHQ
ncbi:hypothetical protein ACFPGO_02055 [Arcanobacterium canis]|uniref:KTSC domain-containing protein n=1 Tax=Arcanobacterium canis TaxID=999183 RepID=A0ABY8FZB8_9ACTO|nr:hypothetical protein [Arcanobacterium canis]WFM82903.1 hypothetical protein P7079_05730 [Arcanobacterium canis]